MAARFHTVRLSASLTTNNLLFNAVPIARTEYESLIGLLAREVGGFDSDLQLGGLFRIPNES